MPITVRGTFVYRAPYVVHPNPTSSDKLDTDFIYVSRPSALENDHRLHKLPEPIPNSEVKLLLARLVLPWGTRWESRVLFSFFAVASNQCQYFFFFLARGRVRLATTSEDDTQRRNAKRKRVLHVVPGYQSYLVPRRSPEQASTRCRFCVRSTWNKKHFKLAFAEIYYRTGTENVEHS